MIIVMERESMGFLSISIQTEHYDLAIVPGIGGRIMEFGSDGVNLLYQNGSLAGYRPRYEAENAEEMHELRERSPQLLYGGEKTWLAPQSDWVGVPYADLDHGEYSWEVQRNEQAVRIVLTSPICRETQLQIIRTVTCVNGMPSIGIEQKLINHGTVPVTKGLWQVTMLNRSGIVDIPDGPLLGSRQPLPLLDEHNAAAVHGTDGWRMVMDNDRLYKLGFMTDGGRAAARHQAANGKTYTLTKTYAVEPEQVYPHHTVVEVYNASDYPYYELEIHSPAYTLQPGESESFTINWELAVDTLH
ncbi:DUF4380 domain-containing protein [Paenibacillus sepulcri]|uniref:DUF4380 domain-containing protein n=1 Tax=Paenibacillus sepulcri TaxID=359917 RepID=A0ABS7C8J7_9BACL|nr:DUF4380 domain-containing protein [Paenibacillus sepulcri]